MYLLYTRIVLPAIILFYFVVFKYSFGVFQGDEFLWDTLFQARGPYLEKNLELLEMFTGMNAEQVDDFVLQLFCLIIIIIITRRSR